MTEEEIKKHKIATKRLEAIKNKALDFIKENLGKVSEYDVQQFIFSEFQKESLFQDKKYPGLIIAINGNSSIVHYYPQKRQSKIIKQNNLILIDIWAKLKETNSPFADITWMAYSGKIIPKEIATTFKIVISARTFALDFIRKNLKNKKFPKTKIIDKAVRNFFEKFGLEKNFLHGAGHSLGISECHGKYFRFGKKSKAGLKPNIPFTIEPGLYFKGKFGIRSEINCYINKDYKLIVTTKIQKEIIKI